MPTKSDYDKFITVDNKDFSVIQNPNEGDAILVNKHNYVDGNIETSVGIINEFLTKEKPFYFCNDKSHHSVSELQNLLRFNIEKRIHNNLLFVDE